MKITVKSLPDFLCDGRDIIKCRRVTANSNCAVTVTMGLSSRDPKSLRFCIACVIAVGNYSPVLNNLGGGRGGNNREAELEFFPHIINKVGLEYLWGYWKNGDIFL